MYLNPTVFRSLVDLLSDPVDDVEAKNGVEGPELERPAIDFKFSDIWRR